MKMDKEKELPRRKRLRLQNFDYSSSGAYFITICTKARKMLFAPVGADSIVKSMIVNNCARGLYTHFVFTLCALGSRTERSGGRLPKAARGSIEARNAAVE